MKNNSDIRFAFFGTPDIAVVSLQKLEEVGLVPAVVITRPDKPAGRGQQLAQSPVKEWAAARGIDVLQPTKIDDAFMDELDNSEWDVFVLVAYGAMLPKRSVDMPRRGTVNMHPSLLPRLRGPSPIVSAILMDEQPTGVTVMQMDEEMDHGPIIAQASVEVDEWPIRAPLLAGILAEEGGKLLAEVLPEWVNEKVESVPQHHEDATYCVKVKKEDGLLSLADDPAQNLRKIRAFEGWPGTYMYFERNGKRIRVAILDAHIAEDGTLAIDTVKPEGKNEMRYPDFLRGGAVPVE